MLTWCLDGYNLIHRPAIINVAVIIKDSCVEFPFQSTEVGESLGLGILCLKKKQRTTDIKIVFSLGLGLASFSQSEGTFEQNAWFHFSQWIPGKEEVAKPLALPTDNFFKDV